MILKFFCKKIADVSINQTNSQYYVDDDFIFPYALEEAIDYLKK